MTCENRLTNRPPLSGARLGGQLGVGLAVDQNQVAVAAGHPLRPGGRMDRTRRRSGRCRRLPAPVRAGLWLGWVRFADDDGPVVAGEELVGGQAMAVGRNPNMPAGDHFDIWHLQPKGGQVGRRRATE
jgi:hypothetical protein